MSVDYNPWVYEDLPGNGRLTIVVDLYAHWFFVGGPRCIAYFNRDIAPLIHSVRVYMVDPLDGGTVPGSTKAGVALNRPRFPYKVIGSPYSLSNSSCNGVARWTILSITDVRFSALSVITYQFNGFPPGDEVVVSPVFTWAGVFTPVGGAVPCR